MDKNVKYTKDTKHISIRMHFLRNGKYCNLHNTVWCEGGIQLAHIGTKDDRVDGLNPRLGYAMVRLEN